VKQRKLENSGDVISFDMIVREFTSLNIIAEIAGNNSGIDFKHNYINVKGMKMQVKLKFRRSVTPAGTVLTRKFNSKKQAREFVKKHDSEIVSARLYVWDNYVYIPSTELK